MVAAAVKESLRQIAERFANTIKKEKAEEAVGNKDKGVGPEKEEAKDDKSDKRDEKEMEKEKAEDNKTDKRVRVSINF